MKVKVKLFATLRNFGPEEQEIEVQENATLGDAINALKLPEKIPLLKIVNGEHRILNYLLKEGDEISLSLHRRRLICRQLQTVSITERNIRSLRDNIPLC